jgi:NAD(P)-dependent dehydrogenase (short-subunit alcohol dehydrogenase family)
MGYTVVIPLREGLEFEASGAKLAIQRSVGEDCEVIVPRVPLDLGSFKSVRAFAKEVQAILAGRGAGLSLLCLNAGRGGSRGDPHELTGDGQEAILQINALSHMLLTAELLPLLRQAPKGARVVSQSSGARKLWRDDSDVPRRMVEEMNGRANTAYDAFRYAEPRVRQSAKCRLRCCRRFNQCYSTVGLLTVSQYCLSKAANCFFTLALNERLVHAQTAAGRGHVIALATDPGFASTGEPANPMR